MKAREEAVAPGRAPADVAVVVPTWNAAHHLGRCLAALAAQEFEAAEIVVVDNGSDDDTLAAVKTRFPEARVIAQGRNSGFATACNAGAGVSEARLVAFLNNDTEPDPGWLDELVTCLERHPRAAAATSKLVRAGDQRVLDDTGDGLSAYGRAYRRGDGELDTGQYDREEQVFGASGAASLWRRDVLQELGGFDEDFFAYYEDVDLSFRARLAGWEIWYAPGAVVSHVGGGTQGPRWGEFAYFYSVRNRLRMLVKNMPSRLLLANAHRIIAGEAMTAARSATDGHLLRTLRAYAAVVGELPALLRKRRALQSRRRASDDEIRRFVDPRYPRVSPAARARSRELSARSSDAA